MNFTMPDDTLYLVMMDLMRRLGQIHHSANFTSRSGDENRSTWKGVVDNLKDFLLVEILLALILNWIE